MKPSRADIEKIIENDEVLNFEGWDLADLDLSGLDLRRAKFWDEKVNRGKFHDNLNLSHGDIRHSYGPLNSEALFQYTNFSGLTWYKGEMKARSFKGANFSNADTYRLYASNNNFSHITAENANFVNCDFDGCDFRNAKLADSNLDVSDFRGSNLQDADLRNSDCNGCDFRGSILRNVDFTNTNLSEAKLQRADFRGANLNGAKLDGAFYSAKTLWPEGFEDYLELCILDRDFIKDFEDEDWNEQDDTFIDLHFPSPRGVEVYIADGQTLATDRFLDNELVFSLDGSLLISCGGNQPPVAWQVKPEGPLEERFDLLTTTTPDLIPAPNLSSKFTTDERELRATNGRFTVEPVLSLTQYGAYTLRLTGDGGSVEFDGHHNSPISAVAISPDGNFLASGDCGGFIKVWSVAEYKEIQNHEPNDGLIRSLAFSPDSQKLVAGDEAYYRNQGMFGEGDYEDNDAPGLLYVIDVPNNKFETVYVGSGRPVRSILFHPSGDFFVSINGSSVTAWHKDFQTYLTK